MVKAQLKQIKLIQLKKLHPGVITRLKVINRWLQASKRLMQLFRLEVANENSSSEIDRLVKQPLPLIQF